MLISKTILTMFLSLSSLIPIRENTEISNRAQKILQNIRIESENTLQVEWNTGAQTPRKLSGKVTRPSAHSPGWITYNYLDKIKTLYGLKDVHRDLKIMTINKSTASINVVLQRQLFQKPVCGNQLFVELDYSGVVQRIESNLHTDLEEKRLGRSMYPAVSVEDAKRVALTYETTVNESKILSVSNPVICRLEKVYLLFMSSRMRKMGFRYP